MVGFADAAKAPRVAGLYAEGRIETGSAQALMLPEGALRARPATAAYVWRVNGRARWPRSPVQLGERDERSGEYPVRSGLADGDRILRNPRQRRWSTASASSSRSRRAGLGGAAAPSATR